MLFPRNVPQMRLFTNLQPTVFFSRLVKWHLGSGGVSLFPYRDRAFLRSKKAKMAVSWRVGELLRGVPRHDVNDEAGRQFGSGSSNLLPGMYRPRATVELATSEILPSEAVQAPQNCDRRSLRTHRKRRRWPDSPGCQTRQAVAEDSFVLAFDLLS